MFVSLNLPTEAEQAEREPQNFLQRHSPPVIIDEVQYAPGYSGISRWRWTPPEIAMDNSSSPALRNSL